MAGGRVYGGSRLTVLCQNDGVPLSCEALDSFFLSGSSPTFLGKISRHRISFLSWFQQANRGLLIIFLLADYSLKHTLFRLDLVFFSVFLFLL